MSKPFITETIGSSDKSHFSKPARQNQQQFRRMRAALHDN